MIRTQIQLSQQQYARLRELAHRQRTSVASLVRQGVDKLLAEGEGEGPASRQQALALAGAFQTNESDIATHHDKYLIHDYQK